MVNCCVNILFNAVDGEYEYPLNVGTSPFYDGEEILYYSFTVEGVDYRLYLEDCIDGIWYITDEISGYVRFQSSGVSCECPESGPEYWEQIDEFVVPVLSMLVYSINCEGNDGYDEPIPDTVDWTSYYPCKHKNAIIKGKRDMSNNIAKIKGAEILQIESCLDDWSDIFKQYLAAHALKCAPLDYYTEEEERCLISHLTTNKC